MPDYSSDLFFPFFLQTTILALIGPLFTILRRAPEAKSAQGKLYSKGSPLSFFTFSRKHTKPDVPKGSPLWIFSELCDFFSKIFQCPQRVPPLSFLILCNVMFVNKSRRVSPFTFFGTMRLLLKEKLFFEKFQFFSKKSVLRFLSLRYGADFRRSRLVPLKEKRRLTTIPSPSMEKPTKRTLSAANLITRYKQPFRVQNTQLPPKK